MKTSPTERELLQEKHGKRQADVLGCILSAGYEGDQATANAYFSQLTPGDFTDYRAREVYKALSEIRAAAKPIDQIELDTQLRLNKAHGAMIAAWAIDLPVRAPVPSAFPSNLFAARDAGARLATADELRGLHDEILAGSIDRPGIANLLEGAAAEVRKGGDAIALQVAPTAAPIGTLTLPPRDDPGELLRHRFLCRGGGVLLAGPTGIGKSSLSLQFALSWALGKECLGLVPARPIRSLIIQAENDDGDLAEMRDGVASGLNLDESERANAFASVLVAQESAKTGFDFFETVVRPLLKQYRVDLLWLDPALSFIGGDANSQKDVSPFLRNGLAPVLKEFNVGAVVVHHTNKPPSGREKPEWSGGDFAYTGSGSAEWGNWHRAVIAVRSTGSHDVFELRAGKRGGRLKWKDPAGQPTYARAIAHARDPGQIFWRDADPEELPKPAGRPKTDPETVLALLAGRSMKTSEWQKTAKEELGVSSSKFYDIKRGLESEKRIFKSAAGGGWAIKKQGPKP